MSPFLPVPLEYLFENPPPEKEANTEFTLKVDPTYGGSNPTPSSEDPNNAPFSFVVMTSPDTIQTTLDRRDGSHWEVFDCLDAVTVGEHTARMLCTDQSETSNCGKIHLGHGVPGTIIQMPEGCGPGNPPGLDASESSPVFDLTFDYDFRRAPRDLGNTQLRIDFSNEPKYWDRVVDEPARGKKTKRSLEDVSGSHKRWLEEEWRDDAHFNDLTPEELHKWWFGQDVIGWLKGLRNGASGGIDRSHSYSDTFILKLIDRRVGCPDVDAELEVEAETSVDVDVDYGFTLIATLGSDEALVDLGKSYLYFRDGGDVSAEFAVEAAVMARFDAKDVLLLSADEFGAAFSVPGIVTIGPDFKLSGRLEGQATLGVKFRASTELAEWDTGRTYPAENDEWVPESDKSPNEDGARILEAPEFEWDFTLDGRVTARVEPAVAFGVDFNEDLLPVDGCAVNLVADGRVTFPAVDAPATFGWALPGSPYPIVSLDPVAIYPGDGRAACWAPGSGKLRMQELAGGNDGSGGSSASIFDRDEIAADFLYERARAYGPLLPRVNGLLCPGEYVTEHVYEVHLLKDVMEFLCGSKGRLPPGYTAASRQWVSEIPIGTETAAGQVISPRAPEWNTHSLFIEMTLGLGGNHNPRGLAIAYKVMNERKKTLFDKKRIDPSPLDTNLKTRKEHRDVYGVFSYMKHSDIWPKFVASSQHTERACQQFDAFYNWGSDAGEVGLPQRAQASPGRGCAICTATLSTSCSRTWRSWPAAGIRRPKRCIGPSTARTTMA
ncbi:hypothetical protein MAPG_05634 [Magnaporthiopsis poae ATCC 64411]|uniref:Uncharacterized protein n=1 Tax=Magnaporthiopsis poae (strain ATCC 64411 / 73-15) TaxID=644358 RepID=A0A0C4DZX3_MAGP6|nr:hypothetical protein MAPG_05634 [Magnaporthiopsis poae ATCC 64411]